MLTTLELHRRFHEKSGVTFATLYPGCIAETGLFRNHVKAFQVLFPKFQKNITQGYVSEDEAGRRLASVVGDKSYSKSGVYWSWDANSEPFVNTLSEEAQVRARALTRPALPADPPAGGGVVGCKRKQVCRQGCWCDAVKAITPPQEGGVTGSPCLARLHRGAVCWDLLHDTHGLVLRQGCIDGSQCWQQAARGA